MAIANDPPSPPDDNADLPGAQPAPRLLVIDDDVTHRTVISRLAQKLGYATTEVGTVPHASALISTEAFDCITLDLNMGGRNGSELLDVIHSKQANVPVIVVSSADNDERWEVLRIATLYGIRVTEVPKPLEIGKLRQVFLEIKDLA